MISRSPIVPQRLRLSIAQAFMLAVWFGIFAGIVEGCLLWLFQNLNWRNWGPTIHFSAGILWTPTLVDVPLFICVGVLVVVLCRLDAHIPAFRTVVLVLTFLTVFDWLSVTGRLYYLASFLLALGVSWAISGQAGRQQKRLLQIFRSSLPWVAGLYLIILIAVQGAVLSRERGIYSALPDPAPDSPNVLVIVVDTLRADHLSSYGYALPTSLVIDKLAKQGVLFQNAVSTSSWSLPSHVSLVTGRDVFEHGITNLQPRSLFDTGKNGLGGAATVGEALERRGYRTGAFSANRTYFTGNLGFYRGFAHFEDYFQSLADRLARTFYGGRLLRLYVKKISGRKMDTLLRYGRGFGLRKRADEINREVLAWLDGPGANQRPFFVFLNYLDVHFPYGGPGINGEDPAERVREIDNYDKSVTYVDSSIGGLMQGLSDRNVLKNTIVIVTSDHGESLGQHGLEFHGTSLYWELIHVPLIVSYPGHIPADLKVLQPVTNASIPSTVLGLLGEKNGFPQPSLTPLWEHRDDTFLTEFEALSELAYDPVANSENKAAEGVVPMASSGSMRSVVTDRWHLITHENQGDQLYDRNADPNETNNLIGTQTGRVTAEELKRKLEDRVRSKGHSLSATYGSTAH